MIDITECDENDLATWDMICSGNVKGCFQIEGSLGVHWSKELKPRNMDELAALISVIRPGTLKARLEGKSMTQHYSDRKAGIEEVPLVHESIDETLRKTHGVIIYQETAMKVAQLMAGFDLVQADVLRKAVGKKNAKLMQEVKVQFIEGSVKLGVSKNKAEEVFSNIEASSRYAFNKSHAVSYAKVAYWTAYCKCHYPKQFYQEWLRSSGDKVDPDLEKKQLIMSAKSDGITVFGPTIKKLDETFTIYDDGIYYGIADVKNVGISHVKQLREALMPLKEPTWPQIALKVIPKVNSRAIGNLIDVGAFSHLGVSRTEMKHQASCLEVATDKEIAWIMTNVNPTSVHHMLTSLLKAGTKKDGGGMATSARVAKITQAIQRLENPGRALVDNPTTYARLEEKLLGCAINHSQLNSCSDAAFANTTCIEIKNGKLAKSTIAGIVKQIKIFRTKKDQDMAFLSIEDESSELENIVVFPDIYEQHKDIIYEESTLLLTGEVKDPKRGSFIVESVFMI